MKTCPLCNADNVDAALQCRQCEAEFATPVMTASNKKSSVGEFDDSYFSKRAKLFFWLAAWGAVALITLVINPASLRAAPIFPLGLFGIFAQGTRTAAWAWFSGSFVIGWVVYVVLSALMFGAKKKNVFFLIYLILCGLLVLNIAGCQKITRDAAQIQ